MKERKTFWDKNAGRYDRFMRKDRAAYDEMYELIRPVVKAKTVLELATGTGLIAKHIVNAAAHIEATDASAEMIAEAKRDNRSAKLHFSVQDMFCLPYADKSFDVVIVSNALHIVPQPEKALAEIRRVLKDDGVLIAPTFTHAENSFSGKVSGNDTAPVSGAEKSGAAVKPPAKARVGFSFWLFGAIFRNDLCSRFLQPKTENPPDKNDGIKPQKFMDTKSLGCNITPLSSSLIVPSACAAILVRSVTVVR